MKIQITTNNQPMSGYLYVSPSQGQDLSNLDNVLADNECNEIFAEDMIDYLPLNKMMPVVTHWVKKLRHNGKIILGGTDVYELSKRVVRGEINTIQANELLFGNQDSTWSVKRGQINMKDLVDLLQELGLKVTKKVLVDMTMVVEAVRE